MKTSSIFPLFSAILLLFISGYSNVGIAQSSPDKQSYIEKVKAFPVTFVVSDSDSGAADVWGRAQSFVASQHLVDCSLQCSRIEWSLGVTCNRNVIGNAAGIKIVDEPQSLLGVCLRNFCSPLRPDN